MFRHHLPRLLLQNLPFRTKPSLGPTFPRVRRLSSRTCCGTRSWREGLARRVGFEAARSPGSGRKGRDPPLPGQREGTFPAPVSRRPSDSLLLIGKGEGSSRARSAEAQRRDAGREAARHPRDPAPVRGSSPGPFTSSAHEEGPATGRSGQRRPRRARPRASCHSPFEMLDDLLFPHILR